MNPLQNQTKVCPNCSYDANPLHFTKCEICGAILSASQQLSALITNEDEARILDPDELRRKNPHLVQNYQEKPNKTKINSQNKSSKSIFNKTWQKELLKPQNLSGLAVLIFSLYLLSNNLLANKKNTEVNKQVNTERGIELVASIKDVNSVPSGIFSYSGDGYFAALLANGLAEEIIKAFPNFDFRYRIPDNQNPDYSVAIDMLAQGEIDFVFNARPLTSTEYAKANLQNIKLQERAIALDGIVFYVNPNVNVSRITISQLMDIFSGKVANWQQLGGDDIAISPVILSQENIELLGFDVSDNANITYVPNHTLAVRKVTEMDGGIGYASPSLVQNQSLIKFLALGQANRLDPSVIDYVPPFIGAGKPNKEAFEQGTYPLTRRLFIVWSDRFLSQAAGTAMSNFLLSYQGQAIVDDSGFVPLRNQEK